MQFLSHQRGNTISYSMILLLVAGLVFFGIKNAAFFSAHPIDSRNSDIIPLIQIMCKRFLSGSYVYSMVTDFGYKLRATYLPAFWAPFTVANLTNIDYRWIAYSAWCIAALLLCIRSMKVSSPILRAMIPLVVFCSYYFLQRQNPGILEMTVELLISGYYMMLIVGLNQQNGVLQGIIISLCLLSRYSLVLWLPLYCFILFVTHNRKQLCLSLTTVTIIVVIAYVIPFLSKDWSIFYNGYKYYDISANGEWTHLNDQGKPGQLFNGAGFALFLLFTFP